MVAILRKVMMGVWYWRKLRGTREASNGGKLHGNISRNGYENAIIGRYGGCFEEGDGGFNAPAKVARY